MMIEEVADSKGLWLQILGLAKRPIAVRIRDGVAFVAGLEQVGEEDYVLDLIAHQADLHGLEIAKYEILGKGT